MGLSQRVTELLERWLGEGEQLAQVAPDITITGTGGNVDTGMANGLTGLVTYTPGHVSTVNSYESTLASGATFTGTAEDIVNHGIISCIITSDQDSATDGFIVEFSTDGTTWVDGDNYTITADITKIFSFQCAAQYFRVRFTNGTDGIANVSIQTVLKPYYVKPSSHRIDDIISPQDDSELVKAVLTAQNLTNNLFVPINASNSGNLQVTDAESGLAIAKGEVVGSSDINKWGNAPDFDEGDGIVTVWDGAEDGSAWELMKYVYSTTADIDSISSSDATDTEEITIVGLDSSYNEVTQTKALQGQTRVALDTSLIRVYRAYNSNGTLFAGHVIVYVNTALTAGVPTDKTKIRVVIHPEEQQTEMALYTIPAGKTGYLLGGYASLSGANKTSNYIISFKTKEFNKVFRTQQKVALSDSGSSFIPFTYPIPQKLTEKTDLEVTAEMTATGGTGASISAGFSVILVDN